MKPKNGNKPNKSTGKTNSRQQNKRGNGGSNAGMRGKQGSKDSKDPRINYDNAREDKVAKQIADDMKKETGNPPEWHFRNPELMRSASSIPFASITGIPVFQENGSEAVPGVMAIGFSHAFGSGRKPIAINQASDANYSFIVHENSRDYNQTAPDYTILSVCGMEVFSILASVIRAYGTVKAPMYQEQNYYKPDVLLRAQGFDPVDLRANLGNMWFDINNFIDQSRQIWIPNIYPLMERWYWLNSNIYQDAEGPRSSMYLFVQNRYLQYDEVRYKTGGSARTVQIKEGSNTLTFDPTARTWTWAQWKSVIQGMIDALINSEDRGMIYGNILKAYGPQRLYELQPIAADYAIQASYNAEVLAMIENITLSQVSVAELIQYEEDLYPAYTAFQTPTNANTLNFGAPQKSVLNFHVSDQPSNELIVEGTRMTTLGATVQNVCRPNAITGEGVDPVFSDILIPDTICAEIANSISVWYYAIDANGVTNLVKGNTKQFYAANNDAAIASITFAPFDWHPFVYVLGDITPSAATPPVGTKFNEPINAYGDYDNYTVLEKGELVKMHNADMYSLWGVPVVLTRQSNTNDK